MAVAMDKSGNSGGQLLSGSYTDPPHMTINRVIDESAGPWGTVTPAFIGEMVANKNDKWTYRAFGLTSNDWEQIQRSNCSE